MFPYFELLISRPEKENVIFHHRVVSPEPEINFQITIMKWYQETEALVTKIYQITRIYNENYMTRSF